MPQQQIAAAIAAHAMWKIRLKAAITHGVTAAEAASARRSDACKFGQWLSSPALAPELRESVNFGEAVRLHSAFHDVVSKTLGDIAAGRNDKAEASIAIGGAFANASATLTAHMMKWQREFAAAPVGAR